MVKVKGIDPLISTVLLIAFTMAIAAILLVWITGFTQQQTNTVGQRGENQFKCTYSNLVVNRNDVSVVGNTVNVTVVYYSGTELLNITAIEIKDANGITYINTTSPNTDSNVKNWAVGAANKLTNYILSGSLPSGVSWSKIKVTALCQNQFAVTSTVTSS